MKLLVAAAIAAALVVTGAIKLELRWWTSSGASNVPAAQDVDRLTQTAAGSRLDASAQNLFASLQGANVKTDAGVSILVHQVPGVASRMAEQSDAARRSLASVRVDTATGRRLRALMRRGLLAQTVMYRDLVAGLERRSTAVSAFRLWVRRYNRLQRWYAAQLETVLAVTASEDRPAVVAALTAA